MTKYEEVLSVFKPSAAMLKKKKKKWKHACLKDKQWSSISLQLEEDDLIISVFFCVCLVLIF